jgi:5-methylthioadenosine/S-adenosylhomocysteine deaminase
MHCPVSNLALHGRIPPAVEWRRAGVTVGLGTDWGDTDMWGTMRAAWLLQQRVPDQPGYRRTDETAPGAGSADRATPADVLLMATRGGARGYSRDDLGEIAPGRTADLVLLDAGRLRPYAHRADVSTLAAAVLATGGPGVVRHVLVAGEWALRDGEPVRVDAAPLADAYHRIAAGLLR